MAMVVMRVQLYFGQLCYIYRENKPLPHNLDLLYSVADHFPWSHTMKLILIIIDSQFINRLTL